MVVLPLVTTITPGGGGTALLRGSHVRMAQWLYEQARASGMLSVPASTTGPLADWTHPCRLQGSAGAKSKRQVAMQVHSVVQEMMHRGGPAAVCE